MPLGEAGLLLPSETHYKAPGAYKSALQAEASKRASYLASMDQFYAQLEEAKRQYDTTLAFKERTFDEELAFNRWVAEENVRLSEASLDLEEEKLGLMERQIAGQYDIGKSSVYNQARQTERAMDLQKEESEWFRNMAQQEFGLKMMAFEGGERPGYQAEEGPTHADIVESQFYGRTTTPDYAGGGGEIYTDYTKGVADEGTSVRYTNEDTASVGGFEGWYDYGDMPF